MLDNKTVRAGTGAVAFGDDARDNTVIINDIPTILAAMRQMQAEQQGAESTALREQYRVTDRALASFFAILQHEQVPPEKLPETLAQIAKQYTELLSQAAALKSTDPANQARLELAHEAIVEGRYEQMDALLIDYDKAETEAEARAAQVLDQHRLNRAAALALRGSASLTQLRYRDAAAHFRLASELVPAGFPDKLGEYLLEYAHALQDFKEHIAMAPAKEGDQKKKHKYIWNLAEPQPIAVPLLGRHAQQLGGKDYRLDYDFVGRESLLSEILTVLKETRNTRGCYLVSGFRGSGKTTLINKALSFYKRGVTTPAWLPMVRKDSYPYWFMRMLSRGLKKLRVCSSCPVDKILRLWVLNLFSVFGTLFSFERINGKSVKERSTYFNRLIKVKVNLGQDESLSTKDVLFNIATLLHQELHEKFKFSGILISFLVALLGASILFYPTVLNYVDSWLINLPMYKKVGGWLQLSNLIGNTWNRVLPIFLIIFAVVFFLWTHRLPTVARILYQLKRLNKQMAYTIVLDRSVQRSGFSLSRKETMLPLSGRQIENELLHILKQCRQQISIFKPDIVFIFDELDKIAHSPSHNEKEGTTKTSDEGDLRERKKKVDHLLGGLKNFITHGQARFFFIAGREMLDSYQAERGSTSSLYESLFNRVFEVPSLLTDTSDQNRQRMHSLLEVYVCRKLLDPDVAVYLWLQHTRRHQSKDPAWEEDIHRKLMYSPFCLRTYYHYLHFVGIQGCEARRIVLGLRNFIQFLTLHSWGNPKRMQTLFLHFTKPQESVDWRQKENVERIVGRTKHVKMALQFGLIDQQRIVLASNLYSQLYHDLGRQLASSSDKLTVSTMAMFQYTLKFHRYPFSRYHLDGMPETLSIYRSPELNTMVDTLLSKVFSSHIRRIRNSHYRYRFNGYFEQEMRYISRVSDTESAAFNFSLDAAAPTKAHYIAQLNNLLKKQSSECATGEVMYDVTIYELCKIIGDLFAQEQSHDEALTYYQMAVDVFDKSPEDRRSRFAHLYVEMLLRLGEIFEQRQSYDQAASVYLHACSTVETLGTRQTRHEALEIGDSKWDVFRQPFWAYWFLHLKRSPSSWLEKLPPKSDYPFKYPFNRPDDYVNHYRAGQLAFFYGCYDTAVDSFIEAIKHCRVEEESTERTAYIGAYAYLHLGENLFVGMMRYILWNKIEGTTLMALSNQSIDKLEIITGKVIHSTITDIDSLRKNYEASDYFKKLSKKGSGKSNQDKEVEFLKKIDVCAMLGMMVHAAKLLENRGLYNHAAIAYLKVLSIWGMFSEVLVVLAQIGSHSDSNKKARQLSTVKVLLDKSETWIADVRIRVAENIVYTTAGGYSRFQARWKSRDVAWLFAEEDACESPDNEPSSLSTKLTKEWELLKTTTFNASGKEGFKLDDTDTTGTELTEIIKTLFPTKKEGETTEQKNVEEGLKKEAEEIEAALVELNICEASKVPFRKERRRQVEILRIKKLLGEKKILEKYKEEEIDEILEQLHKSDCSTAKIFSDISDMVSSPMKLLEKIAGEAYFMQRSMMGQNLLCVSTWEYMLMIRDNPKRKLLAIPLQTMVPHSARGLMFAHWLTGRRCLHREVLNEDNLPKLKSLYQGLELLYKEFLLVAKVVVDSELLKKLPPEFGMSEKCVFDRLVISLLDELEKLMNTTQGYSAETKQKTILGKWNAFQSAYREYDIKRREIYDSAAEAIHNLYRATYYIRQLAGNDQDIMFPDTSMVLYDVWQLLHALVKLETVVVGEKYNKAVDSVKKELSVSNLRHDGTPANFYDLNNVKRRVSAALHDAEQLGDITNRVRSNAISTRHFLSDDYEDPRFHLDWTLVQMYGPAAGILRRYVELCS